MGATSFENVTGLVSSAALAGIENATTAPSVNTPA
jgi:hypothetical protein